MFEEKEVQFSCQEIMFTPSELEELFSLVNQPGILDSKSSSSGLHGPNRAVYSTHQRRMRRKQSNRESAKRSRWRKKEHLENLTNQVNRLKIENQELKNWLNLTMHRNILLSIENEDLRSESVTLLARLSDLCRILGTNMLLQ